MTRLERNRQLISKRDKDKERRSNYFCSKLFLVNIPFMVQYFEQFTNNGFLDWYYERLCVTLFHDVPIWFCDVFMEYKKGTLGRNKSSFLTHSRPVFLFCTPCERQKTLGRVKFQQNCKIYFHCTSSTETSKITQICHSLQTALDSVLVKFYSICRYKILTGLFQRCK